MFKKGRKVSSASKRSKNIIWKEIRSFFNPHDYGVRSIILIKKRC